VLCTVYKKYPKVMTKHSMDGLLVSLILYLCNLSPVYWVSMAIKMCILLFYTLSLKLELVRHLVFNRHEIFTVSRKTLCLLSHYSTTESAIQK